MMQITKADLLLQFRELSDEELVRRFRSGDLTELALEAAQDELQQRNVDPVDFERRRKNEESGAEAISQDVNPSLQDVRPSDTTDAISRAPSKLWWVYFVYLAVALTSGVVSYALSVITSRSQFLAVTTATGLLDVWAFIGFWGYLRSRPIGASWLWVICWSLKAIQIVALIALMVSVARKVATILDLCGLLLEVPLLIALWQYAFLSPGVWKRKRALNV